MKEHTTQSGHTIKLYDNLLNYHERCGLFEQIRQIPFMISTGFDTLLTDQKASFLIKSLWTEESLKSFGLFSLPGMKVVTDQLKDYEFSRAWMNLATPIDRLRYHSDSRTDGFISVLYYLNVSWNINWHCPTVWRTNDLSDIEFVSDFVPGRVVMFDSIIPHVGTQPPLEADQYRLTLNTVWKRK
jgi:hypothetical protein